MKRFLHAVLYVAILTSAACSGASHRENAAPKPALSPGNAEAPPSIRDLPDLDVSRNELSEGMRFAWLLAEQSFELENPIFPPDADAKTLHSWADTELKAWIEKKAKLVEAARAELDKAAEENHRQRVVAGAIVGLMYEDVASVLANVPVPADLREEPEIADVFQQVIQFQASPYLEHARRAYDACSANSLQIETLRHWSRFCATRSERLPAGSSQRQDGTTVQVIAE